MLKRFPQIFGIFFVFSSLAWIVDQNIDYEDCGKSSVCTHYFVIPPEFKEAERFSEGLAPVQLESTILIDEVTLTDGISFSFPYLSEIEIIPKINITDGIKIPDLNSWRYIDKQYGQTKEFHSGEFLTAGIFSEGLAPASKALLPLPNEMFFKMGYIDKSMQFVFTIKTEKVQIIRGFSEGLAAAKREDKWGYIDKTLHWVVLPIYDNVGYFNEGLAWVELDGKYGYISRETKEFFIKPKFDGVGDFSEGLAPVKDGDKWGYISKETKEFVIEPEFRSAGKFSEGLAPVLKVGSLFSDDKWGYINKARKFVIEPKFDGAGIFSEGLAIIAEKVSEDEYKYGYTNKVGEPVVPPKFDGAKRFNEGLAPVKVDDLWGYITIIKAE